VEEGVMADVSFPEDRAAKRAALLDAVERVRVTVEAHVADGERLATLPPATDAALGDAGLFRLKLPAVLGGAEAEPATQIDVIEALSAVDGSAGWCLMVGATTLALPEVFLDDGAVGEMFAAGRIPAPRAATCPPARSSAACSISTPVPGTSW
jgi:alkylation response protein AidB-like acyl-CoA dehydrogenase